MFHKPTQMIQ